MPIIYGFLERITFYNEENDFLVAKLQEKGKRELTTIVGNLSGINAGESLKLSGRWVINKKFGEQFQVESFEVTVPATVHGIKKYLGSGLIKGIGPIMADRIVKKFALETLDIIEKTPERLSEVDGIGPKRIAMITRAKKLVVLIGTKRAVAIAIRNNKPQLRFTHLSGRLVA